MPGAEVLPSTIRRSPKKAQNTWIKAHDSAVKEYGEGRRAHMTAFAALKHSFEKVGDHWEAKNGKGPSDKGATNRSGKTAGGVDANASKEHLQKVAAKLDVSGRSKMTKQELVSAIKKANTKATAKSRPAAKSNGKSTTKSSVSTSKSNGKSAGKTTSRSAGKSTSRSTGKTTGKSTARPAAKSGSKSTARPAAKSGSKSTAKATVSKALKPLKGTKSRSTGKTKSR